MFDIFKKNTEEIASVNKELSPEEVVEWEAMVHDLLNNKDKHAFIIAIDCDRSRADFESLSGRCFARGINKIRILSTIMESMKVDMVDMMMAAKLMDKND